MSRYALACIGWQCKQLEILRQSCAGPAGFAKNEGRPARRSLRWHLGWVRRGAPSLPWQEKRTARRSVPAVAFAVLKWHVSGLRIAGCRNRWLTAKPVFFCLVWLLLVNCGMESAYRIPSSSRGS